MPRARTGGTCRVRSRWAGVDGVVGLRFDWVELVRLVRLACEGGREGWERGGRRRGEEEGT